MLFANIRSHRPMLLDANICSHRPMLLDAKDHP
jgi:hypothetical protein